MSYSIPRKPREDSRKPSNRSSSSRRREDAAGIAPMEDAALLPSIKRKDKADVAMHDTIDCSLLPVQRKGNFGTFGDPTKIICNFHKTIIDKDVKVCHYDLGFEKVESPDNSAGGRGRGGRGRGRGCGRGRGRGRGRGGRAVIDDKPPPLPICVQLVKRIEAKYFRGIKLAHDGKKNVYTSHDPKFGKDAFEVEVEGKRYKVHFSRVNQFSFSQLIGFLNKESPACPKEILQGLDIMCRTTLLRNWLYTGKSFTVAPEVVTESMKIGGGCEAWMSFYQAFKPIDTGLCLGFDVSYTAFYSQQTVLDFALELFGKEKANVKVEGVKAKKEEDMNIKDIVTSFTKEEISHLNNELRGIQVEPSYQPEGPLKRPRPIRKVTLKCCNEIECEDKKGRKVTIAQHFENIGETLTHPFMPCVDTQSGRNGSTFIPLEKAMISSAQRRRRQMPLEMQSRFIRTGAADPIRRSGEIKQMFDKVSSQTQPFLEAFGVKVDDDLQVIEGRIMPPPTIQFGNSSCINVADAETETLAWSMVNQKFWFVNGTLDHWGVLVISATMQVKVREFVRAVAKTASDFGIDVKVPIIGYGDQATVVQDMIQLHKIVSKAAKEEDMSDDDKKQKKKTCRMIMVIKPDACAIDYSQIKNVGETYLGIPTQCIVATHVENMTELYIRNVLLKMNAKLGGVNWSITYDDIEPLKKRMSGQGKPGIGGVMVVGIAVTHQPAHIGKQDSESIAAAVGALDPLCTSWITSIRKQSAVEEGIATTPDMVGDLLEGFYAARGYLPASILVYRAGVSEGQFEDVKAKESVPILSRAGVIGKRILKINDYKPKLTFIVMQKRHHCRFFPGEGSRRDTTGNCVPGTVVDRTVAHVSNFDFYLIAHNACQGTIRPVRYTMLQDDMKFSADEIQSLTFNLCFTFCRSTSPVAEVPAVLYADLLSVRGRAHMSARDMYEMMVQNGERHIVEKLPRELTGRIPRVTRNLKSVMYYV